MNNSDFYSAIKNEKILVVVRSETKDEGVKTFNALSEAKIKFAELSFTSPNHLEILDTIVNKYSSDMVIGAGTILNKTDAILAIKHGAKFLVAPSFNYQVLKIAKKYNVPYIPGIMTPKEIATALDYNLSFLKLFPASQFNFNIVKDYKGPFPNTSYLIMGGVTMANARDWLNSGASVLGIGAAITKGAKEGNFNSVKENAMKFIELIKEKEEC